jgi:hypothetical protein
MVSQGRRSDRLHSVDMPGHRPAFFLAPDPFVYSMPRRSSGSILDLGKIVRLKDIERTVLYNTVWLNLLPWNGSRSTEMEALG